MSTKKNSFEPQLKKGGFGYMMDLRRHAEAVSIALSNWTKAFDVGDTEAMTMYWDIVNESLNDINGTLKKFQESIGK